MMMMMRKKKIAIIGAGNAACVTALYFYFYGKNIFDKIAIYHDSSIPIEKVGQGSTLPFSDLVYKVFGLNWYDNNLINATPKNGILYENWGKKSEKIFHSFPMNYQAFHFVPQLLSKLLIECGLFDVIDKKIINAEEEIDADFIFDCRGRHERDLKLYDKLINPINHVILSRKEGPDLNLTYTRCVATPNGWTFVIPNHDSVSYGYLFNDTITSLEDSKKDFIDIFDVRPDINFHFDNYIAKDCFQGKRTILNGNKLCFLEPLEATSIGFYQSVSQCAWDHIVNNESKKVCNKNIKKEMKKLQSFILWHYQSGSKYDTKFWKYAKSLPFDVDLDFEYCMSFAKENSFYSCRNNFNTSYAQWPLFSFKIWQENI